jgi:hypothetical protein
VDTRPSGISGNGEADTLTKKGARGDLPSQTAFIYFSVGKKAHEEILETGAQGQVEHLHWLSPVQNTDEILSARQS